jgi:hypothetical protein
VGQALESGGAESLEKRGWGKRTEGKSNAPHENRRMGRPRSGIWTGGQFEITRGRVCRMGDALPAEREAQPPTQRCAIGLQMSEQHCVPMVHDIPLCKQVAAWAGVGATMEYLNGNFAVKEAMRFLKSPDAGEAAEDRTRSCRDASRTQATNVCEKAVIPLPVVYQRRDGRGRTAFTNE